MFAVRDPETLCPGDVLMRRGGQVAVVQQALDGQLHVLWQGSSDRGHDVLTRDALLDLRLAAPRGFLWRSVHEPGGLLRALKAAPIDILALIADDAARPLSPAELRHTLVARQVCGVTAAEAWWSSCEEQLGREGDPRVRFDGRTVERSGVSRLPAAPADVFVAASPRERWALWRRVDDDTRQEIVKKAILDGSDDAAALAVRLWPALPAPLVHAALDRTRAGGVHLGASLLTHSRAKEVAPAVTELAGRRSTRGLVGDVIDAVFEPVRTKVVLALLATALGSDDEPAALFLTERLPGGPVAGIARLDELVDRAPLRATLRRWLEERLSESTIERPTGPRAPLLTQLAPLPSARLLPVSIALAKALAERHASRAYGGLEGARWHPDGRVALGIAEESSAQRDVRAAMRRMAELAVGALPRDAPVDDTDLLHHLNALATDLPPSWVAVLTQALAPDARIRPTDGLDLWARLERARVTESLRVAAPRRVAQRVVVGHDTHIGAAKSRSGQTNQDALWWQAEGHVSLLVLADGISVATAGSGDLASRILVRTCARQWDASIEHLLRHGESSAEARRFLDDLLSLANRAICTAARRAVGGDLQRHVPMGTTVVLGLIVGDQLHIATLGDSRAYLVGACGAGVLTGDQNLRLEWLRSWQGDRPIELHGDGNMLTGFVGHFDDQGHPSSHLPVVHRHLTLLPGETLLLCSDGFTDYAATTPSELSRLIEAAAARDDLHDGCRELVQWANRGGGGDNITVMMARQVPV